jgi:hypothetical protein
VRRDRASSRREASRFETFDLTVQLGPNSTPWLSASSRIGLLHGIPRSGPGILSLDELLDLVHDYRDSVRFAESDGAAEISDALRTLIFGDPQVLELFQATRGAAADRGHQTLIRVLASPHLATLPWELLPDPAAGTGQNRTGYLALAPDAHVIRMARGRSYATRAETLEPPLNLLIVLSSPSPRQAGDELLAFDMYEVKRSLLNELDPLIREGLLRVHVEDRPTLENLRRCIGSVSRGFQLFHYVGHALPDKLILEDLAGRREDQDSSRVCEILRMCPELRLATFAGCETARAQTEASDLETRLATGWRDLISLADRCVQDACPMVIGMQAVLPFRTERLFTKFFYQGIASGYSVVEALQLARGAARSDSRAGAELLDWSVPALFVGSGEPGPLVDRNAKGIAPPPFSRRDLKIGLRQSETRFFARDLPLRQTVDVLARRTRERVLVISGAAGVGKTYLVDRALEELGQDASHVIYVRIGRLAPELDAALQALRSAAHDWAVPLRELQSETPHRELCRIVSDVLRQGTTEPRPEKGILLLDWWERIIEDINRVKLVVVIDEFELFDELMDACFSRWLWPVLDRVLDARTWRSTMEFSDALESLLEVIRQGPRENARPAGGAGTKLMQQIEKRVTAGKWKLSPWLKSAACRALEPLILTRLEVTMTGRPPGLELPLTEPADIRAIAERIDETRSRLERALGEMAQRRGGSRTAIVTTFARADFLALTSNERFEMRLAHLTWQETWRWIRRNLPGLTRYGEADLQRVWSSMGPELERWEDLEREVLSRRSVGFTLEGLIQQICPVPAPAKSLQPGLPLISRRRGTRPLRLAIAGHRVRSAASLAQAITRLANENGVGGRVSADTRAEPATLGELIDLPSPFDETGGPVTREKIMKWLSEAMSRSPDLVLLDYGEPLEAASYTLRDMKEREIFARCRHRTLFVAAGDTSGPAVLFEPAIFPEVLAIGAIDQDRVIRPYSPWRPEFCKPDLFMPDGLERSPLFEALRLSDTERSEGTSFAALHAVAAATLVWSLLPELRPIELRKLLMSAAQPIEGEEESDTAAPRSLLLTDVLRAARTRLITDTLRTGPCSRDTLTAITGQDGLYLQEILDEMTRSGAIRRVPGGRLERFELAGA